MTVLPVQRRWFYTLAQLGAICTITSIGVIGIGVRIFDAQTVAPHQSPLSGGVQFLFFFILAAFVWFGGRVSLSLLCDSLTRFTILGIQRPLWCTPAFIPWSTIQALRYAGDTIHVVTPHQRITIRANVFKNPSELVARLQVYLSGSAEQSTTKHS